MVLLNDARMGLSPHWLAYIALGLGVGATLTVNVMSGLVYGPVGAAVAAWPAVALVLSYELLMIIVRRSSAHAPDAAPVSAAPTPGATSTPARRATSGTRKTRRSKPAAARRMSAADREAAVLAAVAASAVPAAHRIWQHRHQRRGRARVLVPAAASAS